MSHRNSGKRCPTRLPSLPDLIGVSAGGQQQVPTTPASTHDRPILPHAEIQRMRTDIVNEMNRDKEKRTKNDKVIKNTEKEKRELEAKTESDIYNFQWQMRNTSSDMCSFIRDAERDLVRNLYQLDVRIESLRFQNENLTVFAEKYRALLRHLDKFPVY